MPVYPGNNFLSEAIESILNQTYRDFELLVICDAPSKSTLELLNECSNADPRVKIIINETRRGLVASRNQGCRLARGEFLNQMDSDDISDIHRFRGQVDFLDQHPDIGAVGTRSVYVNDSGKIIRQFRLPSSTAVIKWTLFFENILGQSTLMIRKELIEKLGYYDERYPMSEDYDLWCRALKVSKISIIPEVLLKYRKHEGNTSWIEAEQIRTCASRINCRIIMENLGDLTDNDQELWKKYFNKVSLKKKEESDRLSAMLQNLYARYTSKETLTRNDKKEIAQDMGYRYAMLAYISRRVSVYLTIRYLLLGWKHNLLLPVKLFESVSGRCVELNQRR